MGSNPIPSAIVSELFATVYDDGGDGILVGRELAVTRNVAVSRQNYA